MFADCCEKETTGGSIPCDATPPVEDLIKLPPKYSGAAG